MNNEGGAISWSEINHVTTYVCTFFAGVGLASTLHSFATGHFGFSVFFFTMTLAAAVTGIGAHLFSRR